MDSSTIPPGSPPDESRAGDIIATLAVTFGLVIITLSLRLWCRYQIKSPGWDDLTAILATCCTLIGLIFNSLFLRWGGARHAIYLSKNELVNARKFSNLAMIPFTFCTAITKISIAFMVIRLTGEKRMKWCMYALIASLILLNGACIIVLFTYCTPSRAFWEPVPHAKCRPTKVLQVASNVQGAWSVVTDLICTATPLIMVWKLQMNVYKKLSVTCLIGFGLVTTACSIGRVVEYNKDVYGDPTWTSVDSILWTTLEENIGLAAANLPALGQFLSSFYEKVLSSPSMRYLLSRSGRSGKSSEKFSQERVPTIGARPKMSRDSDFELMRSEDSFKGV